MNVDEPYRHLLQEIDFLLAERRSLASTGPQFIVRHGYHVPGTLCRAGETIEQVSLWHDFTEYPLRLAPASLFTFDCLARCTNQALTAAKIEEIMLNHPFYTGYGTNLASGERPERMPRRATVKVFIGRIREQLTEVFGLAGLRLDPDRVLLSEPTDSNVVAYRLKAKIEFLHLCKNSYRISA